VVSQLNEVVRIMEWERSQEDAFDEREDGGSSANPESQGKDDCHAEARCFS
jgi:hypothetical protein